MRISVSVDGAAELVDRAEEHAARGEFSPARSLASRALRSRISSRRVGLLRVTEARAAGLMGWLAHNEGDYNRACRLYTLAKQITPTNELRTLRIAHLSLRHAQAIGKIAPRRGLRALASMSELGSGELGPLLQAEYWRRWAEVMEDLVRTGGEDPYKLLDLISLHDDKINRLTIQAEAYDLAGNSQDNAARYGTQLLERGYRFPMTDLERRFASAEELLSQAENINALYLHHLDNFRFLLLVCDSAAADVAYQKAVLLKVSYGLSAEPLKEASSRRHS